MMKVRREAARRLGGADTDRHLDTRGAQPAKPRPETFGSGSRNADTTRVTPASMSAVVHGGVLPSWSHGSRVVYTVAPWALPPAARQGIDLGVVTGAEHAGRSGREHLAVAYEDAPDPGPRGGAPARAERRIEGLAHRVVVAHRNSSGPSDPWAHGGCAARRYHPRSNAGSPKTCTFPVRFGLLVRPAAREEIEGVRGDRQEHVEAFERAARGAGEVADQRLAPCA